MNCDGWFQLSVLRDSIIDSYLIHCIDHKKMALIFFDACSQRTWKTPLWSLFVACFTGLQQLVYHAWTSPYNVCFQATYKFNHNMLAKKYTITFAFWIYYVNRTKWQYIVLKWQNLDIVSIDFHKCFGEQGKTFFFPKRGMLPKQKFLTPAYVIKHAQSSSIFFGAVKISVHTPYNVYTANYA